MKIGNNPELANARSSQAAAARQQQAKAAAPAPAAEAASQGASRVASSGAAASAGVPVTLSSAARAVDASRSSADFDAAKVRAVKAAIENGSFRVDAEAVADKLLANAYEVLSRSAPQG
ncbi:MULTISPECIES: flagellar biosynthesis anti-sigma factor FlgM [Pseudomonadota]|uniref:Negative regulator of flagellin synthesis n=1 Tax=Melaminivora alkalimesophila TaxID=1165852 RepID=A0A317RD74_9BURK|nr:MULTISPECIES: flagellar biosynthesis anti-sigma factor FlgM [Pseudomonadota]MDC6705938.1 flagellar biosynthesis anti-sigma factor FlgM [Leclercia adecarboxylata]PWW44440.1 FlgM family anti-sigma-28 factor [Melaminivora alkalimesophila]